MSCGGGGVERLIAGGNGADGNCEDPEGGVVGGTAFTSGRVTSGVAGESVATEPGGPGVGLRPSRNALAISAAFHFAYLIFSSMALRSMPALSPSKTRKISKKLAAAMNFLAVLLNG